ncbi:MAG: translation elongation factor Ts [Elusimicrobiota bacterium]
MAVTAETVKKLRQMSGAGILECQKALNETAGDIEKAIKLLRERGIVQAAKKSTRNAGDGLISAYIHAGSKLGVLIELNCETDFVAKTDEFKSLVKELTLQIAGANPQWVSRETVPADIIEKEKEIYRVQMAKDTKPKPPEVVEKILLGKLEKFYKDFCLLEQPYVRDPNKTVKDVITENIAKLGENIVVGRFVRYRVGEELETAETKTSDNKVAE